MKVRGFGVLALLAASPAAAQLSPTPAADDPRLQTIVPSTGTSVRLVTFPDAPLTLIMVPGELVERVEVSDSSAFDVKVVGHNDALSIAPRRADAVSAITIVTSRASYAFELETGGGLAAAYLVRLVAGETSGPVAQTSALPDLAGMAGSYRLTGSRELRPIEIADDDTKTYIRWESHQALPAVFGVGPSGEEEVVNGFMRDDLFTIDRVYDALVFRIDKAKAGARRRESLGIR